VSGQGTPEEFAPAILYLDVDDEITSAASRVRAAAEGPVAIVLPHGSRLATSRINFRLLAREASTRGRRLSIVAPDATARSLAASAGLPAYASVAEFESAATAGTLAVVPQDTSRDDSGPTDRSVRTVTTVRQAPVPPSEPTETALPIPDRPEPSGTPRVAPPSGWGSIPVVGRRRGPRAPNARTTVVLVSLAVLVVVVALGGYVLLPSATVTIGPRLEAVGPIRLEIVADPDATTVDPTARVVPAQRLTIDVAVTDSFPATGKRVETTTASGSVTFQNCDTGGSQTVRAGALVSTPSGVGFSTSSVVKISRAKIDIFNGLECMTKVVGVTAVASGSQGNVAAGAITGIPAGYDPIVLRVTNAEPTSGGSETEFPKILQADVDGALGALSAAASTDFVNRIADPVEAPAGATVFDETAQLGELVPTVDPATFVGQEVASFDLGLSATGTVIVVDPGPIRALAETQLLAGIVIPDVLVADSMRITVGDPSVEGELVRFPVTAQASRVRTLDAETLKAAILGLPLREARARLDAEGEANVVVWPDWVTSIPGIDSRVTLTIGDPVEVTP